MRCFCLYPQNRWIYGYHFLQLGACTQFYFGIERIISPKVGGFLWPECGVVEGYPIRCGMGWIGVFR